MSNTSSPPPPSVDEILSHWRQESLIHSTKTRIRPPNPEDMRQRSSVVPEKTSSDALQSLVEPAVPEVVPARRPRLA